MSEMIERVARAMCAEVERWTDATEPQPVWKTLGFASREAFVDNAWPNYASQARVAIEALREPTDDMIAAGIAEADECTDGQTICAICIPEHAWPKMIDAALA